MEFNIRDYYIADDGCIFVFMDYDQQEYRLLGHYGQDEAFMQFIHEGKDIHKATAAVLKYPDYFDVTDEKRTEYYDSIDNDTRGTAKTTNFALVYGLGNPAFANALGHKIDEKLLRQGTVWLYKNYKPWKIPPYYMDVTLDEVMHLLTTTYTGEDIEKVAKGIEYFFSPDVQAGLKHASDTKKQYFNQFKKIKAFINDCSKAAESRGYVKYWTGRRRHFKDAKKEGYKGPNAVIQGGCAEVMKKKLWEIKLFLEKHSYKTKVVNSVHDEAAFMIPFDELHIIPQLRDIMEELPFRVPITCGVDWGFRWGSKKPFTTLEELKEELNIV